MPSSALIVDDEPDLRDILALILEEAQVAVQTVGCGADALTFFDKEPRPGLVLLDLHLPDMDGLAWIERLRHHPHGAAVPVVIISADAAALEAMPSQPHVYCFPKPFPMDALLQLVNQLNP